MAEVSGLRSRNHFEPNCKSRAVDEGKPLFSLSNKCMKVSRHRSQRGELNLDVFSQFLSCLSLWVANSRFSVSQTLLFSVGGPAVSCQMWYPCQNMSPVASEHSVNTVHTVWNWATGIYMFIGVCFLAFKDVFSLRKLLFENDSDPDTNSTGTPPVGGSVVRAVTFTWPAESRPVCAGCSVCKPAWRCTVTVCWLRLHRGLNFETVRFTPVSCNEVSAELLRTHTLIFSSC